MSDNCGKNLSFPPLEVTSLRVSEKEAAEQARRALVDLIPRHACRVLDPACGSGQTTALIRQAIPKCSLTGVELDPVAASQASSHCDNVCTGAGGELRYPPRSADAIVLFDALEHLPDPTDLLHNLLQFLAPDGELFAAVPVGRDPHALAAAAEPWWLRDQVGTAERRFSRAELSALFAAAGYEITQIRLLVDPALGPITPATENGLLVFRWGRIVLGPLSVEELEELGARHVLVVARARHADTQKKDCSFIVPMAAGQEADKRLLEALRVGSKAAHETVLVVTDSDISQAPFEFATAGLRVVRDPRALSVAAACNLGVRRAHGSSVVFVLPNMVPLDNWPTPLLEVLRQSTGQTIVGSVVVDDRGRIVQAGLDLTIDALPFHALPRRRHAGASVAVLPSRPTEAFAAVDLNGMAIDRRGFITCGGLEDTLEPILAATDFCLRWQVRGARVDLCPTGRLMCVAGREAASQSEEFEAGSRDQTIRFLERWDKNPLPHKLMQPPAAATPRRPLVSGKYPVVWSGPVNESGGLAEEARCFILALHRAGIPVLANPLDHRAGDRDRRASDVAALDHLVAVEAPDGFIHVIHTFQACLQRPITQPPSDPRLNKAYQRHPRASRHIVRAMFESDRIPARWLDLCDTMDEIWVPSQFNFETFARSGVDRNKLVVVPGTLPSEFFDSEIPPLKIPGAHGFVFLSVFGWGRRKGWDVLLRAYAAEFTPADQVTLVCKISPSFGLSARDHQAEMEQFIRHDLGRDPNALPRVIVLGWEIDHRTIAALYRAADAFVLPTRGEGWGRPYMEAIAAGLPVIATGWSGHLDFLNHENSYLIDYRLAEASDDLCQEVPSYRGHRVAEPSVDHLRQLMRHVLTHNQEATARGRRARENVVPRYTQDTVTRKIIDLLSRESRKKIAPAVARPRIAVTWEGPVFTHFGMAVVNRELCRELAASDRVDLKILSDRGTSADAAADTRFTSLRALQGGHRADRVDVHIRHEWPPRFIEPAEGRWVLMQPWEFGSPPRSWIDPMNSWLDEVWVPSEYVRDCFIRGGVDAKRIAVIPHGVDVDKFHPEVPSLELVGNASFRFLFVGGTIFRKGIDMLLEAYVRAFRPEDDVCLVVKDLGSDSFYRGQNLRERVLALANDTRTPQVIYIGDELSGNDMVRLYTACDCLVHPYRGEGFGLPIVEAMACGLPVIVPAHGPALELCTAEGAFFLPCRELQLPNCRVGEIETVAPPLMAEVELEALVRSMREVRADPSRAAAMGACGRERAVQHFTWSRAAERILVRLEILLRKPTRRATRPRSIKRGSPRLSVCMIARNEAQLLGRGLESVRAVADEIIVVDTGSTDDTVAIARAHGAQVFHDPWCEDWARARNASIERASGDWILILDADQTIDPQCHTELRRIIGDPTVDGYFLFERSYADETGASAIEHRSLRLFRNRPDIRYAGRIHEQVVSKGQPLPAALCDVIVHHDGYRPGVRDTRQKALRDLPILQAVLRDQPTNAFHTYNLGLTYHALKQHEAAEQAMQQAISLFEQQNLRTFQYAHANVVLALSLIPQRRLDEAAAACRLAASVMPHLPDAHCTLGAVEFRRGNLDSAFGAYRNALACAATPLTEGMRDASAASWKALLGMGEVRLVQNQIDEAADILSRARQLNPTHGPILTALAQAQRAAGRVAEAEKTLHAALATSQPPAHNWSLLAQILIDQGKDNAAEQALREGIGHHPGDFTCHRELARLLRRQGRDKEATAARRELASRAPDSVLPDLLAATAFADTGDLDRALERFAQALALDDRNSDTFRELGLVLLAQGNAKEAEQSFLAATLLDPLDDIARRGLATVRATTRTG